MAQGNVQEGSPVEAPPVRVMVVEDDADYQEVMILILTLEPYVKLVGVESSAEEALGQFERAAPELVVTDYRLPKMNGLAMAEQMKARDPKVKIAMVSAFADEIEDDVKANQAVDLLIAKSRFSLSKIQGLLEAARPR